MRRQKNRDYYGFSEKVPHILARDNYTCQGCGVNEELVKNKMLAELKRASDRRKQIAEIVDVYEWTCYRCGKTATFENPGLTEESDVCEFCGASFGPDYCLAWMAEHKPIRQREILIELPSEKQEIEEHLRLARPALVVHHIDHNERNQFDDNLITLCLTCHHKAHYMERQIYQHLRREKASSRSRVF